MYDDFLPYKNEKKTFSITLDYGTTNKLDRVSNTFDISRNELISQCIEYALEHLAQIKSKNDKAKKSSRMSKEAHEDVHS